MCGKKARRPEMRVEAGCGRPLECQTKGSAVSPEEILGTIVLRDAP